MYKLDFGKLFANYTKIEPIVPPGVWVTLRLSVLLITLGVAALLIADPASGLKLFWGLAIPVVPAVLVLAPGLWRQVCPMAFLNQIPREFNFALEKDLPPSLKEGAFSIAVIGFVAAVATRVALFNSNGPAVAVGIGAMLVMALLGGVIFKGRSGWCGTFCPLGPIQRNYGHAPAILVRNGYCKTCLGCQKNCYDFNPRAAIFSDINDDDPRYTGQRRFFMGMMPGMILGYFLQGPAPDYGMPLYLAILLGAICASAGLYQAIISFAGLSALRTANLFAILAIVIFYYFAGPIIVGALGSFVNFSPSTTLVMITRFAGLVPGAVLAFHGHRNASVF